MTFYPGKSTISYIGRYRRLRIPLQQTFAFQVFQVLDQNFFGDGRNSLPDLAIALASGQEMIQNDGFPIAAYLLHHLGNGAFLKSERFVLLDD